MELTIKRGLTRLSAARLATRVWAWWWIRSLDGTWPVKDEKLALYPQTKTRAFLTYLGRNRGSFSQQIPDSSVVHVPRALPLSPWTATMLRKC